MAWNPAPEVAVARDAAKKLGGSEICIVIYVTKDNKLGMASYGETMQLCKQAGKLGDHLYETSMKWPGW